MSSKLPWRILFTLWAVAAVLSLVGLGNVPLRDFDEATVARVALELHQGQGEAAWLPTLWGNPYLNKAPGLHLIIAALIGINPSSGLPDEWTIRIAPALLSTLVVPLGGLMQWTLRPGDRSSTLAISAILMTLLPVARHGRMAMLDGTQLSVMAALWLGLMHLTSTHQPRRVGLLTGLAASAMLLLKAPLLVPAAAAGALAITWGKEWRHWQLPQTCLGIAAGVAPGLAWHGWHALVRGQSALWLWGGDGAGRVLLDAGEGSDLGWRVPFIEMLEGGWPWLALFPIAVLWAWQLRTTRWGRWSLSLLVVLSASILPLRTQLPWYSHPLWLPVALLCAPLFAWIVNQKASPETPLQLRGLLSRVPRLWTLMGLLLLILLGASMTPLASALSDYRGPAAALGLGWSAGGYLLMTRSIRQRRLGALSLVCGNLGALALIFSSPLWHWELNETWPVKPVADLTTHGQGQQITIVGHNERPSLNWYAKQRIARNRSDKRLRLSDKQQHQCEVLARYQKWTLTNCDNMLLED
ncbi:glycosyltransferase family 39 protein [Synechococcus sp. UW179A]|uniref:ArnT family glycosyltransferase n=1 Tax=Synechococcus sp. UW179A TaxID=2575510 RepID=UPI000E0E66FD|nr:4-amino-4-deoxy-L-arabinose transferase [Synechococcus sp. UW179A]